MAKKTKVDSDSMEEGLAIRTPDNADHWDGSAPVAPPEEEKSPGATLEQRNFERRDRFLRLTPRRVAAAEKALDAIGRLANKASYDCTPEELAKVAQRVQAACDDCLRELAGVAKGRKPFAL